MGVQYGEKPATAVVGTLTCMKKHEIIISVVGRGGNTVIAPFSACRNGQSPAGEFFDEEPLLQAPNGPGTAAENASP